MAISSVVAVAGGTGGLGRAIIDAILADGKQQVFLMTRRIDENTETELGVKTLLVDYTNIAAMKSVLEANNVDTVISTLGTSSIGEAELNLVAAVDQAITSRRYIASNWGAKFPADVQEYFPPAMDKARVLEALERSSLEYTSWSIGIFADYYVSPPQKSHLMIVPPFVDSLNAMAAVPGSGNVYATFTYSTDVGRLVSASLSCPEWPRETLVYGDRLTINELVKVLEDYKGIKFKTVYDAMDNLKAGKITELPSHCQVYPFFPKESLQRVQGNLGLWVEQGIFDIGEKHSVPESFPNIKARTIKELLE